MSNRAQRRAVAKSQQEKSRRLMEDYSRQQKIAGLIQNGITPEDLRQEYRKGQEDGFRQAGQVITKCCYAGIVLALHEEFGFGEDRCFRAIKKVDEKVIYALNHSELVDEVLEKTGLRLELDEPFERVKKA